VQALILCPTRELAEQVSQTLRCLARLIPNIKILNLSGGAPMRPQTGSLRHGAHIIVGTPGRIQKHLDNKALSFEHLKTLVLDEADRMLDMGFYDAIKSIISTTPSQRQTLLFSATYPSEIKKISQIFMKNPVEVQVDTEHSEHHIEQYFYELQSNSDKFQVLKQLLMHYRPLSTIIFCNTKQQTTELSLALNKAGFSSLSLNGDMEQLERDQVVVRFINQSCSILVATDVAARGIDIKKLSAVINFDLAFEPDVHTHRIGRTGRAGEKGLALSLTTAADGPRVCAIEDNSGSPIRWENPELILRDNTMITQPEMVTLSFNVGRKDKIRPGDILGALTKEGGLSSDFIGKIDIATRCTYVAIHRDHVGKGYNHFKNGKLKGQRVQVKLITC
jgi:ATP-independent RNA helicase DbpA